MEAHLDTPSRVCHWLLPSVGASKIPAGRSPHPSGWPGALVPSSSWWAPHGPLPSWGSPHCPGASGLVLPPAPVPSDQPFLTWASVSSCVKSCPAAPMGTAPQRLRRDGADRVCARAAAAVLFGWGGGLTRGRNLRPGGVTEHGRAHVTTVPVGLQTPRADHLGGPLMRNPSRQFVDPVVTARPELTAHLGGFTELWALG